MEDQNRQKGSKSPGKSFPGLMAHTKFRNASENIIGLIAEKSPPFVERKLGSADTGWRGLFERGNFCQGGPILSGMVTNRAHGCTGIGNNRGRGRGPLKGVGDLAFADYSPILALWSGKSTSFGGVTFILVVRFGHMKYVRARTSRTRCAMHIKTLRGDLEKSGS